MATYNQSQTAEALGLSARDFARKLPALIQNEAFPPPYIGDLTGKRGARRRWIAAAITDWLTARSAPIVITPLAAANDTVDPDARHYRPRN